MFSLYRGCVRCGWQPYRAHGWMIGGAGKAKPTYHLGHAKARPIRGDGSGKGGVARRSPLGAAAEAARVGQKTTEKNPAPTERTIATIRSQMIGVRSLRMESMVRPV